MWQPESTEDPGHNMTDASSCDLLYDVIGFRGSQAGERRYTSLRLVVHGGSRRVATYRVDPVECTALGLVALADCDGFAVASLESEPVLPTTVGVQLELACPPLLA